MPKVRGSEEFLKKLRHKVSPRELDFIMLAYRLSKYGHRDQIRDSGERYFEHPKAVALILIDELQIYDAEMIIAALWHDLKEDKPWMLEWKDIELIFGARVRELVHMLTKEPESSTKEKVEYLERIAVAGEDVRFIKLADRLHNVRTLSSCPSKKQARYLKETREFFIPLAHATHPYLAEQIEKECAKITE